MIAETIEYDIRYSNMEEIERLMAEFESCALPGGEWTHHAHLAVGFWYRTRYPEDEAIARIRLDIQCYNLS